MPCQRCKKRESTRHESVRNEDGSWAEVHLCDQCAESSEMSLLTPASLVQALLEGAAAAGAKVAGTARSCPKCGITYAEFRARGRLGCPHDYEAFLPDLVPLLERIHHGGSQHRGKSPASTDGRPEGERELIDLRRALADAIHREQYEEAARIRDRIRVLEEQVAKPRPAGKAAREEPKEPGAPKEPGPKEPGKERKPRGKK